MSEIRSGICEVTILEFLTQLSTFNLHDLLLKAYNSKHTKEVLLLNNIPTCINFKTKYSICYTIKYYYRLCIDTKYLEKFNSSFANARDYIPQKIFNDLRRPFAAQ